MSLLDMPRPWLAQLVQNCCPLDQLSLLSTCTTLRDLTLQHAKGVHLQLSCKGTPSSRSEGRMEKRSRLEQDMQGLPLTQAVLSGDSQLQSLVLALKEVSSPLHLTFAPFTSAAHTAASLSSTGQETGTADTAVAAALADTAAGGEHTSDASSTSRACWLLKAACSVPVTRVDHVTHLTLQGLLILSLAPADLLGHLPQLQHLKLSHCTLQYTSGSFPVAPHHTHLSVLTLDRVEWDTEQPPHKRTGEDLQTLVTRLSVSMVANLPHLSTINITNGGWEGWLAFSACFGSQLHQLSSTSYVSVRAALNLHMSFPQLRQLELPELQVHDERMDVLRQLPCLKHLRVDCFILMDDYTDTDGCEWDVVRVQHIDVASCARLPMHKWGQLEVCGQKPEVWLVDSGEDALADLAITTTALQHVALLDSKGAQTCTTDVSSCHATPQQRLHGKQPEQQQGSGCLRKLLAGLLWSHEVEWVEIVAEDDDPATEDPAPPSDLIVATLPLFRSYSGYLCMRGVWPVSAGLVVALAQMPHLDNLGFMDCTWDTPAVLATLLAALPHVRVLHLGWTDTRFQITLHELDQLFRGAAQKVQVRLQALPGTSGVRGCWDLYHNSCPIGQAAAPELEAEVWSDQVQQLLERHGLTDLVTVDCVVDAHFGH